MGSPVDANMMGGPAGGLGGDWAAYNSFGATDMLTQLEQPQDAGLWTPQQQQSYYSSHQQPAYQQQPAQAYQQQAYQQPAQAYQQPAQAYQHQQPSQAYQQQQPALPYSYPQQYPQQAQMRALQAGLSGAMQPAMHAGAQARQLVQALQPREQQQPQPQPQQHHQPGYLETMWSRKRDVTRLCIYALVVLLGVASNQVLWHYASQYAEAAGLSPWKEVALRVSIPVVALLLIWHLKAFVPR